MNNEECNYSFTALMYAAKHGLDGCVLICLLRQVLM